MSSENQIMSQPHLSMPACFGHGMVLQSAQTINCWGTAKPGAEVRIAFKNDTTTTTADDNGTWKCALASQDISQEASVFSVSSGDEVLSFNDVLVGHVWLCSGQSNMAFPLQNADGGEAEAASADFPKYVICKSYAIDPIKKNTISPEKAGSPYNPISAKNYQHLLIIMPNNYTMN